MTFVPLEAIDGYCGIIEEELGDKLDELSRHLFRVVRDSKPAMGILINDLLAFAHLGRQPLSRQPVSSSASSTKSWTNCAKNMSSGRLRFE